MEMPSRSDDQFNVRLPAGLRATIKRKAKESLRTMNAEIIYQLSRAYEGGEKKKADAAA